MVFSTFTELCDHYHSILLEHFNYAKKKPYTH